MNPATNTSRRVEPVSRTAPPPGQHHPQVAGMAETAVDAGGNHLPARLAGLACFALPRMQLRQPDQDAPAGLMLHPAYQPNVPQQQKRARARLRQNSAAGCISSQKSGTGNSTTKAIRATVSRTRQPNFNFALLCSAGAASGPVKTRPRLRWPQQHRRYPPQVPEFPARKAPPLPAQPTARRRAHNPPAFLS